MASRWILLERGNRKPPKCPYCGNPSRLEYCVQFGHRYRCEPCDAHVGCHKGTLIPFGTIANEELRRARGLAHEMFDALWQVKMEVEQLSKSKAREKGYRWLAKQFGKDAVHIGAMDLAQCARVVELCRPYREKLGRRPTRPNRTPDRL